MSVTIVNEAFSVIKVHTARLEMNVRYGGLAQTCKTCITTHPCQVYLKKNHLSNSFFFSFSVICGICGGGAGGIGPFVGVISLLSTMCTKLDHKDLRSLHLISEPFSLPTHANIFIPSVG